MMWWYDDKDRSNGRGRVMVGGEGGGEGGRGGRIEQLTRGILPYAPRISSRMLTMRRKSERFGCCKWSTFSFSSKKEATTIGAVTWL